MTFVIVMYHTGAPGADLALNEFDAKWNDIFSKCFDTLAELAMSWFFATSGFLLFLNLKRKNFTVKIKKRIYSLLLPYFLWQMIAVIKGLLKGYSYDFKAVIKTIFLFDRWPPDGALWYLYAIFFMALISPIILFIFKKKNLAYVVIVLSIILMYRMSIGESALMSYGYFYNIMTYAPAYVIGCFYGHFAEEMNGLGELKYVVGIIVIALLVDKLYVGFLMKTVIRMLPVIFLYEVPVVRMKYDTVLLKHSFLMYALHQILIGEYREQIHMALGKVIDHICIVNVAGRIISLVIVICVAYVLHWILERICPKLLKALTGGRC